MKGDRGSEIWPAYNDGTGAYCLLYNSIAELNRRGSARGLEHREQRAVASNA
jgi:hypothetical protein